MRLLPFHPFVPPMCRCCAGAVPGRSLLPNAHSETGPGTDRAAPGTPSRWTGKDPCMDQGHFDTLARLISVKQSRRAAMAALLGAIGARHDYSGVLGKGRRTVKAQAKSKEKAKAKPCFAGTRCTP